MFYIIVNPDSGYPVLVYGDEAEAKKVGDINKFPIVEVVPTDKGKEVLKKIVIPNSEAYRRKTGEPADEWIKGKLNDRNH